MFIAKLISNCNYIWVFTIFSRNTLIKFIHDFKFLDWKTGREWFGSKESIPIYIGLWSEAFRNRILLYRCRTKEPDFCMYLLMYIFLTHSFNRFFYSQLPRDFDIIQTIDLLFKIHIMFGTEFDPNLKNVFRFLQYFIYGIPAKTAIKPSNRMKEIYNELNN